MAPLCIGNHFHVDASYVKSISELLPMQRRPQMFTLNNQIQKKYQFSSKNSSCPQLFMISHASCQNLVLIGAKLRVRFLKPILLIQMHAILASVRLLMSIVNLLFTFEEMILS